jgi:O-antigen/teichoic acid export membrane protein
MSRLAGQAIVLTTARIANYGIQVLSPAILVRLMPVAQFGRYREFLVYTSLLIAFAAFNVNDSLFYFVPRNEGSRWRVVKQTTLLVACISVIVVAVAAALDLLVKGALIGRFLLPTILYVLLFVNIDFWESFWLAEHQPIPVFIYTTGRLVARILVVVIAAAMSGDVEVIIWSLIALEAVRLCGSAIAWRALSSIQSTPPLPHLWREQLRFCLPWGMYVIFGMASRNIGNIVVVKALGAVSLAQYAIGLYGEPVILAVRNSISAVLLPEMVRRRAASDSHDYIAVWGRATVINCVILLPAVVLLIRYAEPLVTTIFGPVYRPAAPVLQMYTLVVIRECFDLTLPLRAVSRTRPFIQSSFIALAVNAACLTILVPAAGMIGAIAALGVASLVDAVYLGWRVSQFCNLSLAALLPWRSIAKVGGAAVLAAGVILSDLWTVELGFAGVICAGLAYTVAFVFCLWWFHIDELEFLHSWLRRAKHLQFMRSRS